MPAACSVSAADAGREIRAGSWPEAIRSERRSVRRPSAVRTAAPGLQYPQPPFRRAIQFAARLTEQNWPPRPVLHRAPQGYPQHIPMHGEQNGVQTTCRRISQGNTIMPGSLGRLPFASSRHDPHRGGGAPPGAAPVPPRSRASAGRVRRCPPGGSASYSWSSISLRMRSSFAWTSSRHRIRSSSGLIGAHAAVAIAAQHRH